MLAFLLLLFPCAAVLCCAKRGDRAAVLVCVSGTVSSAVFCAFKFMFSFMHRVSPFDFFANYVYVFISQVFFPSFAVFFIFCIISRDGVRFKSKMFFPLVSSFYAVYLPFYIIGHNESVMSSYELFIKPVLFLAYIAGMSLSIAKITETVSAKKTGFAFAWCVMAICVLLVPAAIEAAWIIGVPDWKYLSSFVAYVVVVSILVALHLKNTKRP